MATVLLTDDEYNHIKAALDDVTSKIAGASPRAATHYASLARLHAQFLAKEDGKRASASARQTTRASVEQARMQRRQAALQAAQARAASPAQPASSGAPRRERAS